MKYQAVLFDLDGTLLNTLGDLADSMNTVLAAMGFAQHPVDAYRFFVGDGVETLARRALPQGHTDEATVARCREAMREEYGRRMYDKTRPYDGIPELIASLESRHIPMTILSNKPDQNTRQIVDRYFGAGRFAVVAGQKQGVAKKPDPAGALEISRTLGIPTERFLYLGDTSTDMQAARAAGMFPVGALWGFRPEEELLEHGAKKLISEPAELLRLLG
jgi:phosphoglycolate phosphatase